MKGPAAKRYQWVAPAPVPSKQGEALSSALGVPSDVCEVLIRRGYGEPEAAKAFLRPDPAALLSPLALPDMATARDRLERAVTAEETILVHGDYDADGLSSAALLTRGIKELGGRVEAFVPHRTRDGYDLGEAGLAKARDLGADVIVTADCGVSAIDAVSRAAAAGVDVVVTDHHRPGPDLPGAVAVVNPNRKDADYPFRHLAGVGVAFKLLCALFQRAKVPEEHLNQYLDLVAVGSVSDRVPLIGENRTLVRMGLRALERTRKPGLRALIETSGLVPGETLTARHVGFSLGPRLNAAGRVGSPNDALNLLLTDDEEEARALARRLDLYNERRRAADRQLVQEAEEKLRTEFLPDRDRIVVLWADGWNPGVLGLAASRLVDRFHRPTVLLSFDGEHGRGSARSIEGFHLFHALEECGSVLERFGGHSMAAGLDIHRSQLEAFEELLRAYADRVLPLEKLVPRLSIDLVVSLRTVTRELFRRLSYLAPFGEGNPRPVLKVEGVTISNPSRVGTEGAHLRAVLAHGKERLRAIGFRLGPRMDEVRGESRWDVAFELEEDRWRGRSRLSARLLDFHPAAG